MKKIFKLFIGTITLIYSCDNPNSQNRVAEEANLSNIKADIAKLNDLLKGIEDPAQKFNVPTNKPSIVTGRKGTKIAINPDDLITESGSPLGKNISVELKELTNQTELLKANAQTISDGKLLISGGAYFIGMSSNGENLKLKDGKALKVQFPKISKKEMKLFYGERDELGQMNWQNTDENFREAEQVQPKLESVKKITKKERKSDLDAILDYVETGDTTTTPEGRARAAEWEKENKVQQQKAEAEFKKRQREFELSQKMYEEINVKLLGWINCDIFLNAENGTSLFVSINPDNGIEGASLYLIFEDINTLSQGYYFPNKEFQFKFLPLGYKAKLIAFAIKDEIVYAYSTDFTITRDQKMAITLKEINEQDFKKLLKH